MKSIVVASGKGGTGKTSMTAVFASLASQRHAITLADTDVEASNLPLAVHVQDASCAQFPGLAKAAIAADRCTECGLCVRECRFGAISTDGPGAYRIDPYVCEGCGLCTMVCPSGAILSIPSSAGEACTGHSDVGPIAYGQLGPGQDLSGKLVTEVRRLALEAAARHCADVLLIDGPPGTGCPLIAAVASTDLVVAVAEPTVSGSHDLSRLAHLVARFSIPMRVVLNKADLSAEGAKGVRRVCADRALPIVSEVPFDPEFGLSLQSQATRSDGWLPAKSAGWQAAAGAWIELEAELGLSGLR